MRRSISILILFVATLSVYGQLPDDYEPLSRPSSGRVDSAETSVQTRPPRDLGEQSFTDRLVYGGNLQLNFGSFTLIEVSPRVGYRVTDGLITGIGTNFMYLRYAQNLSYPGSPAVDFTIWGGNVFASYNLPMGLPLAVQGEYEMLNFDVYDYQTFEYERQWVPAARLGGGYFQPLNNRGGGVYFVALYDFLWDRNKSLNRGSPWTLRANFFF